MEQRAITGLGERPGRHIGLSKDRRETLAMLTVGMVSARTVNLSHVASERAGCGVRIASTYRRLQRFFQHVRPAPDWAAEVIAGLAGGADRRTLILDRTNWKIGAKHVNLLVLGVATRHSQAALMWTVLDRPGNSGARERVRLIERYIAVFGKDSIGMLLADREFIGADWLNWLNENDIPFTIRVRAGLRARRADGRDRTLARLMARPRTGRRCSATLTGMTAPLHFAAGPPAGRARDRSGGEPVIVATNRPDRNPLARYRKRWAIESLFGNTKTRGLNFEDTRLTDPAKLHLLTAIVALAAAWAIRAARTVLGQTAPPRKSHGYLAKSYFRTGFDFIRNRLRSDPDNAITEWINLNIQPKKTRVVQ